MVVVYCKPDHHFKTFWEKPNRFSWDCQVHSEYFKKLPRAGKLRRIRRDMAELLWADKASQKAAPSGYWAQHNTRNCTAVEQGVCCHSGIEGSPYCSPRLPPSTCVPASSSLLSWQPSGWPVWKCLASVMGFSSEVLLKKALSQQGLWYLSVGSKAISSGSHFSPNLTKAWLMSPAATELGLYSHKSSASHTEHLQ